MTGFFVIKILKKKIGQIRSNILTKIDQSDILRT